MINIAAAVTAVPTEASLDTTPALLSNPFFTIGLPIALFIIMLGMGLSLVREDFARIREHPKAVVVGTIGQMLLIPLLGFVIAYLMLGQLGVMMAAGLVLVAILPGGTTSNLLTYLAKANVALSITLTVIASLVTIISMPALLELALELFADKGQEIPSDWLRSMLIIFLLVILPVGIGMLIRRQAPEFAQRMEKPTSIFSFIVMITIVVLIVVLESDRIVDWVSAVIVPVLILNFGSMGLAFGLAKLSGLVGRDAITVVIELSIKNSTIGLTLAFVVLGNEQLGIPSAVYGLVMYLSALILAGISRRMVHAN